MIHFPLQFRFKFFALNPQIFVEDADGKLFYYVRQKFFKLKESVKIFSDIAQANLVMQIDADKIIDFSANYMIRDLEGNEIGSIQRQGMRSLWKAHYILQYRGSQFGFVEEANPWVKFWDGFLGNIPLIGLLSTYLFHPAYNVMKSDGTLLYRLLKKPSFFEKRFSLECMSSLNSDEEKFVVAALIMMILLERKRG